MKLVVVAVGQRVPDWAQTAWNDYVKRFPPELKVELKAVKTEPRGSKTLDTLLAAERERIDAAVPKNGAPMSLVTYDQVKQAVMSRGLLTRISLENGNSSLMPNGGPRMPQATIDIIVKWEKDGLLEK